MKNRKQRRNIKSIGIEQYNFDFAREKNIYCYVCCSRLKKKELRTINSQYKFESYLDWERYVQNKYKNCSDDQLKQFSRYLNQNIRNVKPGKEYINICFPVIVTLAFSKYLEYVGVFEWNSNILLVFIYVVIMFALLLFIMILLSYILTPLLDNNIVENMFKDYKEIIDDMIK